MLDQWFSYRRRDRTKPLIGDKRPPSPLEKIQPDGWLAEYTEDLLNLLNVLGRLVALEPRQADLLDRIVAGPLVAVAERDTGVGDNGRRTVAIARVLWQTAPADSLRDEDDPPAMTRPDQLDLFGESQPELPGLEATAGVYRADPDEVRAELLAVLAQAARGAELSRGTRAARSTGAPSFRR